AMTHSDSSPADFGATVAIVGVGLIGGSIAAALEDRGCAGRIVGVGRNPKRLAAARDAGLIDAFAEEIAAVSADFWVFCTPVDRIVSGILAVKAQPGQTVLVTDAGSVKAEICESVKGRLSEGVEFIGSHPLAGSEQRGFEYADANLYRDRMCVLTPEPGSSPKQLARLRSFWTFVGMRVVEMGAAEHDRALAETSHLPHLVASALAATLNKDNAHLAATGFADTTRIAAGDPDLWTAIFLQNADAMQLALNRFTDQIDQLRDAIANQDGRALRKLLEFAKTQRDNLN
ncbi:MAG: prephenate dehydrogenase, partial [Planctomycetaceae bacterium]|nr:prephenate dehydrogenase [Planctomycetaceae bacterium]